MSPAEGGTARAEPALEPPADGGPAARSSAGRPTSELRWERPIRTPDRGWTTVRPDGTRADDRAHGAGRPGDDLIDRVPHDGSSNGDRMVGTDGVRADGRADARRDRPRAAGRPVARGGIRLNGLWCALLLIAGVTGALVLAGSIGWQPGVRTTLLLAAVGVMVALLAGRGGRFEAGVLPGTVVIVVGAVLVASDAGALGGAVGGYGAFGRVWEAIGLLAPAAATTWVCALVTLALRRAGLLRRL